MKNFYLRLALAFLMAAALPGFLLAQGNALNFDGANDYVALPPAALNDLTTGTFETWVYLNSNIEGTILMKQSENVGTQAALTVGFYASSTSAPVTGVPGTIYYRSQNTGTLLTSNTKLLAGQWYHLALTFTATAATLYINGVVDVTVTGGNFVVPNVLSTGYAINTTIGTWVTNNTPQQRLNGSLDELRIFNTDRTPSISTDMLNTIPTSTSGLVAYYQFDQGTTGGSNTSITSLTDNSSAAANSGTLTNFGLIGSTSNFLESYAMVVPTVAAATDIKSTSFVANWSAPVVGVAGNYLLDVSTTSNFSSFATGYNAKSIAGTILLDTVKLLSANTMYYYRVRSNAANAAGLGALSAIASATTSPPMPTITSVSLLTAGVGAIDTIRGSLFTGATAVTFGGVNALSFTVLSDSVIVATIANGASGNINVTTPNGTAVKTGFTFITTAPPGNALLSDLVISSVIFDPIFDTNTTNYTASVANAIAPVTATPTLSDVTATVQVRLNGGVYATVSNNTASSAMLLKSGSNIIDVKVTAQDGTTITTYSVTIIKAQSSNADLSGLAISSGNLSPVFAPNTLTYTAIATSAYLTPSLADSTATIQVRVNGGTYTTVANKAASVLLPLNAGDNTVEITTTSEDGTTSKTYAITVTAYAPPTVSLFTPTSGLPNTEVTITGTNFNPVKANNIVFFGATMATVSAATATSITVNLPNGATYGPITVLNAETGLLAYSAGFFKPVFSPAKPSISGNDFAGSAYFASGASPRFTLISDFDSDGKPDMAIPNIGSGGVSVLRNTSTSGNFIFPDRYFFSTNKSSAPFSLAVGDIDGDGRPDMVTANENKTISVFLNNSVVGSGVISFATRSDFPATAAPSCIAIGDLDGDGKPDLAVSVTATINSKSVGHISIYRNIGSVGNANFSTSIDVPAGSIPIYVSIVDINADGKPDVIATNRDGSDPSLLILANASTSGAINFPTLSKVAVPGIANGLAVGDIDGDGKQDLLTSSYYIATGNAINVYRNNGTGNAVSFETNSMVVSGFPNDLTVGDLNGDGKLDIAYADGSGSGNGSGTQNGLRYNYILQNTSTGLRISFTNKIALLSNESPVGVSINDMDGDGKSDIILANYSINKVAVIRTNPQYSINTNLLSLTIGAATASPAFAPGTITYTATVGANSITLTPTLADVISTLQMRINGGGYTTITSGALIDLPLDPGNNTIELLVTAQSGAVKTYTISVTASPLANAELASLVSNTGTLSPTFVSVTTGYSARVSNATTTIAITPTFSDPLATAQIRLNGGSFSPISNATTSGDFALNVGVNIIEVLVTAQDGITTATYTTTITRRAAQPGNALNFVNSNVNIFNSATTANFTAEAYIKTTDASRTGSAAYEGSLLFGADVPGNANDFTISVLNGTINFFDGNVGQNTAGATNVTDGKWHHIAVVRESGVSVRIYIDGVLDATGSRVGSGLLNANPVIKLGGGSFNGSMDEVRIWNSARTKVQIEATMLTDISGSTPGLLAYYNFDNGTAGDINTGLNTLTDQTANLYNGTMSGFALSGTSSNWVESYAMVVPIPTAATNITSTGFTANWMAPEVGTVTNYLLDVSTSPTFATTLPDYSALRVTGTFQHVSGLVLSNTYYYRVRADKTSVTGEGGFSNVIIATTKACTPGEDMLAANANEGNGTITGGQSLMLMVDGSDCKEVASLLSMGDSPVTGPIAAKVWIQATQPSKYVKRHYEITPATNPSTATGKITLYFTQQEFTDFNAKNSTKLPVDPADTEGYKSNLLIEKRPGTSSDGTGLPDTYTGSADKFKPSDRNGSVVWNAADGRWEVSFEVTGFSGFFVKTADGPLPLRLISFTGTQEAASNKLFWQTADEVNTLSFEVESSRNGRNFGKVATIKALGTGNNSYSYTDIITYSGILYYRLKMIDMDGTFTYSRMLPLTREGNRTINIYPNPVADRLTLSLGYGLINTEAMLYDISGRLLQTIKIASNEELVNVKTLPAGVYIIQFKDGTEGSFVKE
jgi:hypothetical protein